MKQIKQNTVQQQNKITKHRGLYD